MKNLLIALVIIMGLYAAFPSSLIIKPIGDPILILNEDGTITVEFHRKVRWFTQVAGYFSHTVYGPDNLECHSKGVTIYEPTRDGDGGEKTISRYALQSPLLNCVLLEIAEADAKGEIPEIHYRTLRSVLLFNFFPMNISTSQGHFKVVDNRGS